MKHKGLFIGSIAVLSSLIVYGYLLTPVFAHLGYGPMMNKDYSSQNWENNSCPMWNSDGNQNQPGNGWEMMNWR